LKSNDRLIDEMTCNLTPVRWPTPLVDGVIHISVGIAELLPFLVLGFMRRDIPKVPHIPLSGGSSSASACSRSPMGQLLSFPAIGSNLDVERCTVRWVSLWAVAGRAIDASNADLDAPLSRLDGRNGARRCAEIVLLSVPAIVGRALPMRRLPDRPTGGFAAFALASAVIPGPGTATLVW